jgi:hypothetical protein
MTPRRDLTGLTPYEKRATWKRSPRRNRSRHRCAEWTGDGRRCTSRTVAGTPYCPMHTPEGGGP